MRKFKNVLMLISSLRLIPHYLLYKFKCNEYLTKDLMRYSNSSFWYQMTFEPTFRNLFYVRAGLISWLFMPLAPRCSSLHLDRNKPIGAGCKFVHSYWTYIHVEKIGENFECLHNVTIGDYNGYGLPTIGNNVSVYAGAVISGPIMIGDNVKIGAGAVVSKNVPSNCTVVGNPAFIYRLNGKKVHIDL